MPPRLGPPSHPPIPPLWVAAERHIELLALRGSFPLALSTRDTAYMPVLLSQYKRRFFKRKLEANR